MNKKYQLLNELAKKGQTFTFEDASRTSSLSHQSLKVAVSRMEKEGLIERIEKGKYLIIPLGARKGRYTINEFIIGSQLIQPAVIAYWSALNYHGLTEQIPGTVFIQTTSRKKEQQLEILGVRYRFVRVTGKKLFGYEKVWIEDVAVEITDPEKTVVDCLDKPQYCGGIAEAAKALQGDLDIEKLKKYAIDIGNSAVIKRLGILCDKMGIKIDIKPGLLSGNYPLLDPSMHGKGILNRKWKIRENVDEKYMVD
ncbi:MAG: type IV toxin-antitoxin system AbiEi family antitoxin domain-containing protein [Candidatus Methanoperedenaceae archaeon]|nr:type IV toxin-antitoxin system AbiEi family antitoxin domain-containing protein [Candidatus Methanoperedenaceae archaeon]